MRAVVLTEAKKKQGRAIALNPSLYLQPVVSHHAWTPIPCHGKDSNSEEEGGEFHHTLRARSKGIIQSCVYYRESPGSGCINPIPTMAEMRVFLSILRDSSYKP